MIRARTRFGLGLALLSLPLAGCATEIEDPGSDTLTNIQGGAPDTGDPAVGLLVFDDGGYCTGSLIASNVVLTAAHCVKKPIVGFYTTNGTVYATVKNEVQSTRKAGGYLDLWCPNPTHDVALVRLKNPIKTIAPLAYGKSVPSTGTLCRVVGFGIHNTATGVERKRKRAGTSEIRSVFADTIKVEYETAVADSGDSGGPLLCGGAIVGTVACHTDGDWPSHRTEYYERTSSLNSWIGDTIKEWAPISSTP